MLWGPGEGLKLKLARALWSASDLCNPVRTQRCPAIQGFFPWLKLGLRVWEDATGNAVESR